MPLCVLQQFEADEEVVLSPLCRGVKLTPDRMHAVAVGGIINIDGASHVHLFGEGIPVNVAIHTINGFSAHAGQAELLAWHRQTGSPERTFLVHGEQDTMRRFAAFLRNTRVEMPGPHQIFEL
jgi:Cft2 family RNA processing exonuclease